MRSVVFVCILLVAMVTSDEEVTTSQPQQPSTTVHQNATSNSTGVDNSTDVTSAGTAISSSGTDVSNVTDDGDTDITDSNDVARAGDGSNSIKSVVVESCTINSDQYNRLNSKLTRLALQLERLQTAVDNLDLRAPTKTVSGTNTLFRRHHLLPPRRNTSVTSRLRSCTLSLAQPHEQKSFNHS